MCLSASKFELNKKWIFKCIKSTRVFVVANTQALCECVDDIFVSSIL